MLPAAVDTAASNVGCPFAPCAEDITTCCGDRGVGEYGGAATRRRVLSPDCDIFVGFAFGHPAQAFELHTGEGAGDGYKPIANTQHVEEIVEEDEL